MPDHRPSYHHGNLRRALVAAALARLGAGGQASLSLRALAADVGVTPRAVYRHFPKLDDLRAAVAVEGFELLDRQLVLAHGADRPGLQELVAAYLRFAQDNPELYAFIFGTNHFGTGADDALRDASFRAFGRLAAAIEACLPAERHGEAPELAHTIWAGLHGAVQLGRAQLLPVGAATQPARRAEAIRAIGTRLTGLVS